MKQHANEPWSAVEVTKDEDQLIKIRASNGANIARLWIDVDDKHFSDEQRENARRIVACVNACRNLSNDELEQKGLVTSISARFLAAERSCDELLAALEASLAAMEHMGNVLNEMDAVTEEDEVHYAAFEQAREAITKAKGGAA